MDHNGRGACAGRQQIIWGLFLLALGVGWALASAGLITFNFWRYAGPLALVAVATTMLWRAQKTT